MKKEIKIALVAIAGIVILYFGMNFLKGMSVFAEKNVYYATFENIEGLTVSNPIFANGYQVGVVKQIDFDYSNPGCILVRFSLNDEMRLPMGTKAEIESDFMGNVKMNLVMGQTGKEVIAQGDTISGGLRQGLMSRAAAMVPQVEKMLPKLDSILLSLNTLLADPSIARSLHNVETVTADLTTSTRELNTLMASLNKQVPSMIVKADGILDNTQALTANLATVDVGATVAKVDKTIAQVEALTGKLNQPNSSLGMLMNDPSLYQQLNTTVESADKLLNDLRQHPKRYVHFSVFGKKEK